MGISRGSVRTNAKALAQNNSETNGVGVALLLSDPGDYNLAIRDALRIYDGHKANTRVVDQVVATTAKRLVLCGSGALSGLTGADSYSKAKSQLLEVFYPWDPDVLTEPVDPNDYRLVLDPGGKVVLESKIGDFVAGRTLRLVFTRPHSLDEAPATVTAPATAPTASLKSPAAAGNVDNGLHSWVYTFVTAAGETTPSPASAGVTVADKSVNGQVSLVVPISDDYGVVARRIYRTVAGDTGSRKLVGTISDNSTTAFTDNVADVSLGAVVPAANTAGGAQSVDDDDEDTLTLLAGSLILQLAANKAVQNTGNTGLPNDTVDRRTQSDVFKSRAGDLRKLYDSLVGLGGDEQIQPAGVFAHVDAEMSSGQDYFFHRRR